MSCMSLNERIWSQIDTSGGPDACWPWTGGKSSDGYPLVGVDGKKEYVHRIVSGAQPGQHARHSCDNPPCCNPKHVAAGTRAENMADMAAKGRSAHGEKHGRHKLTFVQVIAIRGDQRLLREIAAEHGVNKSLISKIKNGKNWRLLAGTEETYT